MKRIFLLSLVLLLMLSACGGKQEQSTPNPAAEKLPATSAETLAPGTPLELTDWNMNATAWSSPNGATVNISAIPNGYAKGQYVMFSVRLEGDEVANIPCSWNGSVYSASVDLNAADGYCYFLILNDADGTKTEIAVNTPSVMFDESLVNLKSALNAYCEAEVSEFQTEGSQITIAKGSLKVQLPWLNTDAPAVTCESAALVLCYQNTDVATQTLPVPQAGEKGVCTMDLSGIAFSIPDSVEEDHQLELRLDVQISNGQLLRAPAGTWYYLDGQLLLALG